MKCKSDLRRAVLEERKRLPAQEIRRRGEAAGSHFVGLPEYARARVVMFFVSFGSEIDTRPMIRQALADGKRVAAPRAEPRSRRLVACEIQDPEQDLAPGAHDIREPKDYCPEVAPESIDVVVVPAAVWGEDGYRVGYGAGYYDRFLGEVEGAARVGLGLELQVVREVPHDSHDLPVDMLVTETGVRRFRGRERESSQRNEEQEGNDGKR